jgi:hypothetical protein
MAIRDKPGQYARTDGQCKETGKKNLRKKQEEMLEIKNSVTLVNNASSGFISTLDAPKEKVSEVDASTKISRTEK